MLRSRDNITRRKKLYAIGSNRFIKRRKGAVSLRLQGFTLIELLVVIAIISLLVSILLPSLKVAKELAKQSVCMGKLRACGMGMMLYAEDYDEVIPLYFYGTWEGSSGRMYRWSEFMRKNGGEYVAKESMVCPSLWPFKWDTTGELTSVPQSYVYGAIRLGNSTPGYILPDGCNPSSYSTFLRLDNALGNCPILADSACIYSVKMVQRYLITWYSGTLVRNGMVHLRHPDEKGNVLFVDGHVSACNDQEVIDLGLRGAAFSDGSLSLNW